MADGETDMGRTLRARAARAGATLCAVVLATAAVGAVPAGAQSGNTLLGTKNAAKGAPVKVGVISNGKTASLDNSDEGRTADAVVQWVNEYQGGLGGRPIDLVLCEDGNEPSKAVDCANQMIQEDVVAVVVGQNGVAESSWRVLNAAGIPYFVYGVGSTTVTGDAKSTFNLTNSKAALLGLPAGVAKKAKAEQVSAVIIDVPAATDIYKGTGEQFFDDLKLDFELVPVPAGTADMTPQMQRVVNENPDGVVMVVGNDAFCIAAFNGLRAAGFEGDPTTIAQCITDATRTGVPADFLEGMQISSFSPVTNAKDPSIKQFNAVLDAYDADVDRTGSYGIAMFSTLGAFAAATKGVKGEVTPASVTAAIKSMPWTEIPGTGGLHFRCNGKADPAQPAVCTSATNAARLDATGTPKKYTPVNDTPIPD